MAIDYCDPADVYAHGIPRGAVAEPARLIREGQISAAADTITLNGHGFALDTPVQFRADAGGTLPAPLLEGTTYYAVPVDPFHFKVAAAPAGAALDLTTAGSRVSVYDAGDPLVPHIKWASRLLDDMFPAHVVPLTAPVPEIVRYTCAELAAGKWAARGGATSVALQGLVDAALKRVQRWAAGVPVRGAPVQPAANLAASLSMSASDQSGWRKYGGL